MVVLLPYGEVARPLLLLQDSSAASGLDVTLGACAVGCLYVAAGEGDADRPVVARAISVGVHVGRSAIEICNLIQLERRVGRRKGSPKVVVCHVVVADAGV